MGMGVENDKIDRALSSTDFDRLKEVEKKKGFLEASDKNDKKFDDKVNNFLRFAMDNFETELVVMGIKLALTQYSLPIDPDEVECFDEFHERFGKYITAAQQA